jgi:Rrf2 family protein
MLSATTDYALRAILTLARAPGRGVLRAEQIADAIGAPPNYLAKTLNQLARAGLLASARGPAGGFALAIAPETLTLATIVDLFEQPRRSPVCLLGARPCDATAPCIAHARWSDVTTTRRAPLLETTIADLLGTDPARDRDSRPPARASALVP